MRWMLTLPPVGLAGAAVGVNAAAVVIIGYDLLLPLVCLPPPLHDTCLWVGRQTGRQAGVVTEGLSPVACVVAGQNDDRGSATCCNRAESSGGTMY